jgi:hypothetical protein
MLFTEIISSPLRVFFSLQSFSHSYKEYRWGSARKKALMGWEAAKNDIMRQK